MTGTTHNHRAITHESLVDTANAMAAAAAAHTATTDTRRELDRYVVAARACQLLAAIIEDDETMLRYAEAKADIDSSGLLPAGWKTHIPTAWYETAEMAVYIHDADGNVVARLDWEDEITAWWWAVRDATSWRNVEPREDRSSRSALAALAAALASRTH